MIPFYDPLSVGLGCVLIVLAAAAAIADLAAIVLALRRRMRAGVAFGIGAASHFVFAATLLQLFSSRGMVSSWIIAIFFAPVAFGLLAMAFALLVSVRQRLPRPPLAIRATLVLLGAVATTTIAVSWRDMTLREALYYAVLYEDVAETRGLLHSGAAHDRADAPFRQRLLTDAARDANPGLVEALVAAGADPKSPSDGKTALIQAITADPVMRVHEIDPKTHARNRFRTVEFLVEHGADPNAPAAPGGATPAETAWFAGLTDLSQLLKTKGAKDSESIPARFDALMRAAAGGDVVTVNALIAARIGKHQTSPDGRSPLVAAAENGQLATLDALLHTYGVLVSCDLVQSAMQGAVRENHFDVFKRLLKLCFNEYDGTPLVDAAGGGRLDMVQAALARGYSPQTPDRNRRTALQAATEGGHADVIRALTDAQARHVPRRK